MFAPPKHLPWLLCTLLCVAAACGTADENAEPTGTLRAEPADPFNDPAGFTISGNTATMSGVIDSSFENQIELLLFRHPEVTAIVMTNAPGSDDDDVNVRAALRIHEADIATEALASSEIASGAVDFFLAGTRRTVPDGAMLGVHSWAGNGTTGDALPMDSSQHDLFLDYYRAIGISEDFYWFTLQAAPFDDIHWMTREEIALYNVETR